jgi:hypothetical protein
MTKDRRTGLGTIYREQLDKDLKALEIKLKGQGKSPQFIKAEKQKHIDERREFLHDLLAGDLASKTAHLRELHAKTGKQSKTAVDPEVEWKAQKDAMVREANAKRAKEQRVKLNKKRHLP